MIKSNLRHLKMTRRGFISVDKFKNRKLLLLNPIQYIITYIIIFLFPAIFVKGKLRHSFMQKLFIIPKSKL